MIIATAGHVDHGKTQLVRALTGIDTDRLDEEKSRGLTIDLGFAYIDSPLGNRLGFIDVPGHVKFINNMVAGVGAVDLALLVVAADDGTMPQTREHLAILNLLGVRRGIVALTKIDRVAESRVKEVQTEIENLLTLTALEKSTIYPVSSITGAGIKSLSKGLDEIADALDEKCPKGHFRLAIDRCFTVKGSGVVVTGSVFSGSVNEGDELTLQPQNTSVRVRALHTQNKPTKSAHVGDRCAVNIVGTNLSRSSIHRGNWLSGNDRDSPTDRFDIRLSVLDTESTPLRHWTPVHVHTAANHVTGRVAVLEQRSINPGTSALAQIVLSEPINLCIRDQVILRDQAAQRTLGGGPTLHPQSPKRGRAKPERIATLQVIDAHLDSNQTIIEQILAREKEGLDIDQWTSTLNLTPKEFAQYCQGSVRVEGRAISKLQLQKHGEDILTTMKTWHSENPNETGITLPSLAKNLGIKHRPLLRELLDALISSGKLNNRVGNYALPGAQASLTENEDTIWLRVKEILLRDDTKPPVTHEIAKELGIAPKELEKVLIRCTKIGYVVRPVFNRFLLPEALEKLRKTLLDTVNENNEITVKQYRDATGIGRNLSIEILEYFDNHGITQRRGDVRKLLKQE
ncbi:MAG: selenocysteine-specific translation elongation factor [Gammaproteobacteria bacterium]|nr:selenocysteine-specific translation elongation factor [Gammaproteobacteria bacterium]